MKILFLCNANMCRSPLAEGLLRLIFKKRQINALVDSAGFEAFHINELPDERAIQTAIEHGVDISTKRVRLFKQKDFDTFDKIYVMDTLTYRNAMYFARSEKDKHKVDFLMNVIEPGRNKPVPDPFYEDLEAGEKTYEILMKACNKIADNVATGQLN
ncbi:MAG: low molecular weight protein-tyrosine-phosphatase [Bacteroidales bacterium]